MGSVGNFVNISRQFLSQAFENQLDITDYKVTEGTKPGDNFTSLIYSAEIHAKDKKGDEITRHLLLKCYPEHPGRQDFGNRTNMFFKELEIYRVWMPELRRFQTEVIGLEEPLKLPYAPFVNGKCIDFSSPDGKSLASEYEGKQMDPLDNYIIMDDLRKAGYRMTNRREPMDIDHVRLVIAEMAKVHALSWAYKTHVAKDVTAKYPCLLSDFMNNEKEMMLTLMENNILQAVKTIENVLGPENKLSIALKNFHQITEKVLDVFIGLEADEKLDAYLRVPHDGRFGKDAENPEPWRIICHGDCWSNNMLFKYDENNNKPVDVVLVDLQMVRESCVMPDLVYAIYACTDAAFRKAHLEELMKLYVDTFNDICRTLKTDTHPGFSLDSFKYRFHRFKPLGIFMALMVFPIMLKEEENALAQNMEDMAQDAGFEDMFKTLSQTSSQNTVYNDRLIGMVQELYDEGVI